ncbi:MAG: ParB/RepB/Spo0J family partition protein [Flavobacteriales bacterium]|jgi:ParB family chromosome partitioning protein|nr:ParB/RepB/Spo0J family partition protein [Flavobacteriales bacterium]MDP4717984.1 ParB/RepB/Spo0J family partition protein [Flavobacteriales bacterium]MDP4732055.1 ParB/RepB/Spo0J family partition protein [Flavobacteriales bacterium]MDP4817381.1 ParB/RepB/Spo0J family partition protein [Flavobacteriales bacterium]MDP4951059.1 ParB/RepB/Spo0J family partition protein [Flavobacteriales bacterium]
MSKKQALGRGLSALLEHSPATSKSELVSQAAPPTNEKEVGHVAGPISLLSISQIEANPYQPRKDFNNDALIELATSIGELGLIQPITVRKVSSQKYQIISGERRFRASQMANLTEVPVYIRETDDQGMLEMALVENIQRENLNALEIAISYKRLMEECSLTTDKLADRVGKDRTTVTNYVRLLRLPPEIQLGIIEKRISMGHARALINAEPESKQIKIFKLILEKDLSVRKVEELVKEDDAPKLFTSKANLMPLEIQKMQADLKLRFGKKAKVTRNDGGVGKVEIPFTNDDDLERIIAMLGLNA